MKVLRSSKTNSNTRVLTPLISRRLKRVKEVCKSDDVTFEQFSEAILVPGTKLAQSALRTHYRLYKKYFDFL